MCKFLMLALGSSEFFFFYVLISEEQQFLKVRP